jgi:murein DD-endopeptidase MepM/ murein hydrolase activator NlpD
MKLRKDFLLEWVSTQYFQLAWHKVCLFFEKAYREREIILRSQGQLNYLRLTRQMQVFSSVVVFCFFGWAFGMTVLWEVQRDVIDQKIGKIKDSEVAYGDLLDEILTYQEKVAEVIKKLQVKHTYLLKELGDGTGSFAVGSSEKMLVGDRALAPTPFNEIDESRQSLRIHLAQVDIELEQMTYTTNLLENSLSKVKARLAQAEYEGDSFPRHGDSMQDHIRELEEQLVKARVRYARLDRAKKGLDQNLNSARNSYTQVVQERGTLERRKRELENDLGASRARGDSLHKEVTKLGQALDTAQVKITTIVEHRSALRALVSRLEAQLQMAEARIVGLETDFNGVITKLEESTGGRDGDEGDVQLMEMPLSKRANILLRQLAEIQNSQETVLDQLHDRTLGNVKDAERILEMAGLDLAKVFERVGSLPNGEGGPLVNGDGEATVMIPALATTLTAVEYHVTRWEALKSVLASIPLISPVDYYHLASGFGKRRDPFTNRWAMHSGLDLAGWRKAPVYSTAPGIIVVAGKNGRYGMMVEIDHGNGIRTRYGHLFKVTVRKGEKVGHRRKVGLLGSTGRSTGPHVHYEVLFDGKQLDPLKFIKAGRHVFKSPEAGSKAKVTGRKSSG